MDTKDVAIQPSSEKEISKRSYAFQYFLIIIIGCFVMLALFAKIYPYFWFDLLITKSMQQISLPIFQDFMKAVSFAGSITGGGTILIIACLVLIFFKKKVEAVLIIISTAGIYLAGFILKALIARPRPDPALIFQLEIEKKADSFPSGHVLFAMGFYALLFFLVFSLLKKNLARKIILAILLFEIITMGFSRIYLGVHWFSDVLGSYIFGSIWLLLMVFMYRKIIQKK